MAAVRESMRSPLEGDSSEINERVVLGTLPPEDKRAAKPSRVGIALAVIISIAIIAVLLLVPFFWDAISR